MNTSSLTRLNLRALAFAGFALALCAGARTSRAEEPKAPPAIVEIGQATAAHLASQRWVPGSVVSRDDAKVASAEAGRIEFVAEVGTRVKVGERLAQLDDQALRLRREEIQSDVRRAEAQRALAQTQLERLEKLGTTNAIAKTQVDEARATLETDAQTLAHSRAQQRQIEHDIEQAEVRAPFAGIVSERFAQRGEYVQIGTTIVHLVDIEHVEARVQAPLALAKVMRAGMEVKVKSGGAETSAKVRAVVPVGDERARQFELRVGVDPALALVGSAVEVALPEDGADDALTVPRDAIVQRANQTYVMRVSAQNTAEQVPVATTLASGDKVEVRGALAVGDRLVVRGAERLNPGQAVKIANEGNKVANEAKPG